MVSTSVQGENARVLRSEVMTLLEKGVIESPGVGVFDASVPPQGGGSNRGGVNGLYLGVLLSYVVWELTG